MLFSSSVFFSGLKSMLLTEEEEEEDKKFSILLF